ncbi:DUF2336 domain-containing protein [Roseibium litorale]|uniref:DUF2336 domain-containing protein n=1 Tax=Roseibium litorale TaxID=2803841 RepID=A0ABR9CIH1_9HYPH|nr:DUF2336 domain-containing protein [Roseibium litorale]MBD8890611.1 DUF2336 domain-containing protein [Roseibium litorale]
MTKEFKTELVNFQELDGSTGQSRSAELARHVATLFAFTSDRCSDAQVQTYDGVLLRLIGMVEVEVRRYVAEQLASLKRGPGATIRSLAEDEISVAGPILRESPVLADADLLEIAEKNGSGHLFAIAQRGSLSSGVTDVLVERGDLQVKRQLAGNAGAAFSDETLMRLIGEGAADATIQLSLSDRGDLAEHHIRKLVSVASDEVRRKLLGQGETNQADRLGDVNDVVAQRITNEYWLSRYDFETACKRVLLLGKRGMVNEASLRRFAAEDAFPEAVACFAWMVRCGVEEASHWMVRADPEPFVVVARAAGLSAITVSSLLSVGPWRQRLTPEARAEAMRVFERMSTGEAKRRIAHWSHVVLN